MLLFIGRKRDGNTLEIKSYEKNINLKKKKIIITKNIFSHYFDPLGTEIPKNITTKPIQILLDDIWEV